MSNDYKQQQINTIKLCYAGLRPTVEVGDDDPVTGHDTNPIDYYDCSLQAQQCPLNGKVDAHCTDTLCELAIWTQRLRAILELMEDGYYYRRNDENI